MDQLYAKEVYFCSFVTKSNQESEAESGLVKSVVMTNLFFNSQQHKIEIKWFICVKNVRSSFFSNS